MIRLAQTIGLGMTYVSLALMILLSVPIAYEAIARAFGAPTIWVFETTLYAFIFLGFMGNALAVKSGAHFRVTLLKDAMPHRAWLFNLIADLSTLAFALLIIAAGAYFVADLVKNEVVSASLLEVPLWIPALAIPLGGFGLFLQTLVKIMQGDGDLDLHLSGD